MTNKRHTVLYTGVTNHLGYRVWQHKTKENPNSFTARYNVNTLVYYCSSESIEDAIAHEKQIKNYSRKRKEELIASMNPWWEDLSNEIGIQDILETPASSESHGIATLHPTLETTRLHSQ